MLRRLLGNLNRWWTVRFSVLRLLQKAHYPESRPMLAGGPAEEDVDVGKPVRVPMTPLNQ